MHIKKKLLLIIAAIAIPLLSIAVYLNYFSPFGYSLCSGTAVGYLSDYIKEARWEGNVLTIKSEANENCCLAGLTGNYHVNGQNLTLNVNGIYGLLACGCDCDYDNQFKISDLDKRDYNVTLNVNNKEMDYLFLKTDNSVSDYCDNNTNYNCYKYRNLQQNTMEENKTKIIRFAKPEYEEISNKYPEFLEFFKKYDPYNYNERYDVYVFDFVDSGLKGIQLNASRKGVTSVGIFQQGDNFEDAVKKYIEEKRNQYMAEGSLAQTLNNRLNLTVTYVAPNGCCFHFIYDGEEIDYSGYIIFLDRDESLTFAFKDLNPSPDMITLQELKDIIGVADKAFYYIDKNKKIRKDGHLSVDISKNTQKARISAFVDINESETQSRIVIHNYNLPVTEPVQKSYILDLRTGEFQEKSAIWGTDFEF